MKSRQFKSFEEAVSYCESKGKLKFYGRIGIDYEYCTYTLMIGSTVYEIDIRDDGYLRVRHERYRMDHD